VESPLLGYSRWALALTAAAMWSHVWRFKVGPFPTNVLEILILATIVLYIVGRWQSGGWRYRRTGLEIPTALLLLAALIGIAVSPDHIGALGLYRAYFIEPVILFYIAIDLLRAREHFRVVLLGLAVGVTFFAILNLGVWADVLLTHQPVATGNAPEALYTSPNQVALFYEPALAMAAAFALYANSSRDRAVALVCLVFLFPAMILTLSRGGYLTLIALALTAVITMPQRRLKIALLAGAVIGGLGLAQVPYVSIRLAHQLDPSYRFNTFEGRLQIWSDTLRMLRDHPIFGAGLRAYARVMAPYVTPPRTPELYPHDVWLAMWSEIGLLGLAAFVVLLAILLWRGWRGFAAATGFWRPVLWGTAAAFVTVAVHGMVDTPYFKNDLAVEFWIFAAFQVAAIRIIATSATRNQAVER
jgi:putative inorganic carbon (HCO3(-)) transporter